MIILPLQWEKHTGPDAVGQHKLVFTLDESVNHGEFNPMVLKKGTQFLVMMVEAGSPESDTFVSETKEETLDRFRRQMHSILSEISEIKGTSMVDEKNKIKEILKKEGKIKESTTELGLDALASVIIRLKKYKNGLNQPR